MTGTQKTNTADPPIGIAIGLGLGLGLAIGLAIGLGIAIGLAIDTDVAQKWLIEAQLKLQYSTCNPLQMVNRYLPVARVTEQDG